MTGMEHRTGVSRVSSDQYQCQYQYHVQRMQPVAQVSNVFHQEQYYRKKMEQKQVSTGFHHGHGHGQYHMKRMDKVQRVSPVSPLYHYDQYHLKRVLWSRYIVTYGHIPSMEVWNNIQRCIRLASQTNSWDKSIKQIYKLGTVDRNKNKMPAQNLKRRKITPYRQKLCYNVGKQGSKVKTNQNKFNQLQPMMPVCPAVVKNIDHTKEKEEKKEIFNENKLNEDINGNEIQSKTVNNDHSESKNQISKFNERSNKTLQEKNAKHSLITKKGETKKESKESDQLRFPRTRKPRKCKENFISITKVPTRPRRNK